MADYGSIVSERISSSTNREREIRRNGSVTVNGADDTTALLRSSSSHNSNYNTDLEVPSGGIPVYWCFLLWGIGTLLPWNVFITAESYWQYKFRNTTNITHNTDAEDLHLQDLFTPLQVSLAQIINFIFLFINALFSHKVSQQIRLIGSLVVMLVLFTLTTALVKVNTDKWQLTFFSITMCTIILMNVAGAIFQGGLFGLAGKFPLTYINAVSKGLSLSGVFTSVAQVLATVFDTHPVMSALIYFLIAVLVMVITLIVYVLVSRTKFFKYYAYPRASEDESSVKADPTFYDTFRIIKSIWPLAIAVCFMYIVTLSIFPVVSVRIISTSTNTHWADHYFQRVLTFLLFNVGDFVSRFVAEKTLWPKQGSKFLYGMVLLRVVFIPLFLLCNHDPLSVIPSIFRHDAWYGVFMVLFSMSNGYISSLLMMYAPRMVSDADAEKAGSIMAASLGLGLLIGAGISFSLSYLM